MRNCIMSVLLPALFLFIAPGALATQVQPSTLENMTEMSDTIAVGRVNGKRSYWENQRIFTDVTVQAEEFIKTGQGKSSPLIRIKLPGGRVGDVTLEVDMAPDFRVGEKTMLFLRKGNNYFVPFGFYYGVMKIVPDGSTGRDVVVGPYLREDTHFDLTTGRRFPNRDLLLSDGMDAELFMRRVKEMVRGGPQ